MKSELERFMDDLNELGSEYTDLSKSQLITLMDAYERSRIANSLNELVDLVREKG